MISSSSSSSRFLYSALLVATLLVVAGNNVVSGFVVVRPTGKTTTTTELNMVFDFFKQKSEEFSAELDKFAEGLAKSRVRLQEGLETVLTGKSPEEALEDLEDILLQSDLGIAVAEEVVQEVRDLREDSTTMLSQKDLKSILRGKLIEALDTGRPGAIQFSSSEDVPTVLFVMGANGMGKTTTIGKLAHRLRTEGNQKVLMAACDTFRAGAVEQLAQWADRAQVDIYGPSENVASPSAVLYGALDKAINEKYDTLLVDTSGRLSNNDALTAELLKMKKVIQKRLSVEKDKDGKPIPNMNVPHDTLLVLDAAQGRMALDSARVWDKEIGLDGLILTKIDGSAKGGSVVAVSRDLKLPVKLLGVGEGMEDLRDFQPEKFVDGLLGIGAAGGNRGAGNEGAMLAARLDTMRKERSERAKVVQKMPVAAGAPVGGPPQPQEMMTAQTAGNGRGSGRKTNKNKKKKRKNRK